MSKRIWTRRTLCLAVGTAFCGAATAQSAVQLPTVEVVGTTPLSGLGVAREQVPANVQSTRARELREKEAQNLPEFMARQLPSVNVNEIQGNPYQADLNYRGFVASPLLGNPQGLSVYLDGVRANEAFGDTVNWDLIPKSAIASMDLMPGSNPLFGLNTLGGALSLRTKNGFDDAGAEIEVSAGSFGRRNVEASYGGKQGTLGWFVAADWFDEDGWRDHSPSDVKQFFGKLSHRGERLEADLSLTHGRSDLIGNGVLPQSMLRERGDQIFTYPDNTKNQMTQLALTGKWWLSDASNLSGSLYHRRTRTNTLNGDVNDEYADNFPLVAETGAHNRTRTVQLGQGASLQWNLIDERHTFAAGISHDQARVAFRQSAAAGMIDASRGVADLEAAEIENKLRGTTRTSSLFVTDTYALTETLHLSASARYNASRVTTTDQLNLVPPNLDGDHRYRKLNPALGLTWQALPSLNAYLGFNQGTRVPTPIELGCADPANPCSLPNAMAADPFLKQVVSRTLEAGVRGKLAGDIRWNAGVFRTLSKDDILFVGTSTSAGYFDNFGETLRQGIELGASGRYRRFDWSASYSYLHATFRSDACVLAENNSSAGASALCAGDEIRVKSGDRIPGLPAHSLKLGLSWKALDWLRVGGDLQAFSSQYVRGNENNQHRAGSAGGETYEGPGKIPGYAIVNVNADADLGAGWEVFAKVTNLFDKHYATGGILAENPFTNGTFQADPGDWRHETFVAPGAPRAGWLGVRYRFGGR